MKGRLLSDSALTTYFGKPAFHAYGNKNIHPAQGGLVYGDYMKTHNINPHSGDNNPARVQIYSRTMLGIQKSQIKTTKVGNKLCKSVEVT